MILKLKYAASMLAPIVIDQISEVAPVAGCYYMSPGKHRKWEIHTRLHGVEDSMDAGIVLDENCTFYDGCLEPESVHSEEGDENPVRVALRVLKLDLRDGTTRHIYYPTEFFEVFLMSDEGKTIDRLPK